VVAVHAGEGSLPTGEWRGRAIDITIVLRDPEDLARRARGAGLEVTEMVVRPPYPDEHGTERCYLVARRR